MEQYIMPLSANRKLKAAKSIDQTAYIYGATGYGKTTFVQKYLAKRRHTYLNCGNRRWDENDIPAQGIVVLDDLHLLDESRRETVRSIVAMPEVWLIIVSRSPVPAWLMPEYINVGFMIISENDLRLGRKEIAGYLDRLGLSCTEDGLRLLTENSEGNAYAVRHAALKMAEGMTPGPQMQKEIHDGFARYLTDHVVVEWDSELLEFLMKVSVVDEFTLPLAELITASRQASVYLQKAAETGNFLFFEDDRYRLRPVLLHALRERARQSLGEEQLRTCAKNAGVWYEMNGHISEALEMYEQAENWAQIRELLIRNARTNPGAGHYYELRRYYLSMDEEEAAKSPVLMAGLSMLHSMLMDEEKSEYWYKKLADFAKTATGGTKREAQSRLCYLDIGLPHRGSRDVLKIMLRAPAMLLDQGARLPEFSVTSNVPSTMNGGKDFCRWSRSDRALARTVGPLVERVLGSYGKGLTKIALGESLFEKGGDAFEVLTLLSRGQVETECGGRPEIAFSAVGQRVRMMILQGDLLNAGTILDSFQKAVEEQRVMQLLPNIRAMRCRIALYAGDMEAVREWLKEAPDEDKEFITMERYRYLTKVTGEGTVASTAGKYYIEYSEDSLTPAADMDLTYDGTNLRNEVEEQAKEKTPDTTILGRTFTLGGDNLAIGYLYGSSACPAGEGGNRFIEFNYDVAAFPYHRISYRHYFSVKKLQITNATTLEKTVNLNTPYTGSPVNFPETFLKVTHNGKQIIINGNFDISYSNNVEVGDNAVITLTGKNNVEGTLALNYTISPKDLYTSEIVLSSAEKVYDGTTGIAPEKVLSLANKGVVDRDKGMVGITADVAFDTKDVGDEKNITISNIQLTGEKAGNYKFPSTITLPSSTTGKITPAPLSVTVTGKDKSYDGTTAAQVDVAFTGLQHGETLSASDYTVTAAFATPGAGTDKPITGSVTLNNTAAASNYTLADGSFQTTANISKAVLTLTAPTSSDIQYGQTLASAELSGGSALSGGQAVEGSWSWANPQVRPLEDGSYTVKFTPEDGANYAVGETQATVSVTPAQPKIIISAPSRQQAGHTVAVTVHVENPHDRNLTDGIPVPTVTYKIGDSEFNSLENGALLIPENTADDTVITIKAVTPEAAGKYTAGEKTFDITVVDKAPVTLSGIVLEDKTYDGQPAVYSGTPTAADESSAPVEGLTYSYQWKDAEGNNLTEAPKNAGSYYCPAPFLSESGPQVSDVSFCLPSITACFL